MADKIFLIVDEFYAIITALHGLKCQFSELAYLNPKLWQYGLWSFQTGGTKLERFLHKNQHIQRKLLNYEFWINDELLKIGRHFSSEKKIDFIKKCQ